MSDRPEPATSSTTPVNGSSARALSPREQDVLAWMVEHAQPLDAGGSDDVVEDADRARWRAQLTTTRAGRPCDCGSCPSIELTGTAGTRSETTGSRVVLEAQTDEAVLLLFVDDDRLSYLELAPTGDRTFAEFPAPTDLRTT